MEARNALHLTIREVLENAPPNVDLAMVMDAVIRARFVVMLLHENSQDLTTKRC